MRKLVLLLICLAFPGCNNDNSQTPTVNGEITEGRYSLTLSSEHFGSTPLDGDSVSTSWAADTGAIFLGADENNQPLGTLTMTVGPVYTHPNGLRTVNVLSAVLSKSDVRVGTAEELNAMTYNLISAPDANHIFSVEIGTNYIRGNMSTVLFERVLFYPEDVPDIATVSGEFVAINN